MATKDERKASLIVRNANPDDVLEIARLTRKVYSGTPYTPAQIRGQISNFPQGQFVAVYEGQIVGYCASFRIAGTIALKPHTWKEITGNAYGSRHDPQGEYLYGMEVCIDPDYRRLRIGQRLYNERRKLCRRLHLAGIVFGGRIPNFHKKRKLVSDANAYIEAVQNKQIKDPVLSFHLRNGFEPLGLLKNYIPDDKDSGGYGVHLVWKNPQIDTRYKDSNKREQYSQAVRVGTVQYKQRPVQDFNEFKRFIEYFVDVVSDYKADFVVFPELFTLQLLSIENKPLSPDESIDRLTTYTEDFVEFMRDQAIRYNINIIGGSHPTKNEQGKILNISYAFLRDGSVHQQPKVHPTPNERYWWNIDGGSEASVINTDCGPIGILICYDCEFPELPRHLVDQGAQILFVPFCTDERQSYLRVRYCAQARAVENQTYVVLSGNVGNLPGVENMDIQYAQTCILTPCDFAFARDGIAADTTPNVETVAIADLHMSSLIAARNTGTVTNLKDRRYDLYAVSWQPSQGGEP